eukprot:3490189-Rhodomonas_salina.4
MPKLLGMNSDLRTVHGVSPGHLLADLTTDHSLPAATIRSLAINLGRHSIAPLEHVGEIQPLLLLLLLKRRHERGIRTAHALCQHRTSHSASLHGQTSTHLFSPPHRATWHVRMFLRAASTAVSTWHRLAKQSLDPTRCGSDSAARRCYTRGSDTGSCPDQQPPSPNTHSCVKPEQPTTARIWQVTHLQERVFEVLAVVELVPVRALLPILLRVRKPAILDAVAHEAVKCVPSRVSCLPVRASAVGKQLADRRSHLLFARFEADRPRILASNSQRKRPAAARFDADPVDFERGRRVQLHKLLLVDRKVRVLLVHWRAVHDRAQLQVVAAAA